MKVIRKDEMKKLSNLKQGEVFCWLDDYYMVLDRYNSEKAQQLCANIETGSTMYFDYDTDVTPLNAKAVIE